MFNLREGAVVLIIVFFLGVFLTAPLSSSPPSQLHVVLNGISNVTNNSGMQKISDTNYAIIISPLVINGAYHLTWNDTLLAWYTNGVGSFQVQYSGPPQTVAGKFAISAVPAGGAMATSGKMTVTVLGIDSASGRAQVSAFVGVGDIQNPVTNQVVGHAAATTWPVLIGGTATVTPAP